MKNLTLLLITSFLALPLKAEKSLSSLNPEEKKKVFVTVLLENERSRRVPGQPVLLSMMVDGEVKATRVHRTNDSGVAVYELTDVPRSGVEIHANFFELNETIQIKPFDTDVVVVLAPDYSPL